MAQRGEVSCPRSPSLSVLGPEMNPWFLDGHTLDLIPSHPLALIISLALPAWARLRKVGLLGWYLQYQDRVHPS